MEPDTLNTPPTTDSQQTESQAGHKPVVTLVLVIVLVLILALFFYFWSNRQAEPVPEAPVYTELEREEILNSLRAPSVEEVSIEEREEAMQSLRAPSESEISVTEREQILDSLRAR